MREEYDFTNSVANPYAKKTKKQISIKLEIETVEYFKILAKKVGIPYQNLINSYLSDCAKNKITPTMNWGVS
ncbi:MAG: antitoxin [Sulfurovum sp.]|jgi:predicted DNA binding CopG/RHH family protein|nr:MAG: antitoxin [Sulfurovum sp.]